MSAPEPDIATGREPASTASGGQTGAGGSTAPSGSDTGGGISGATSGSGGFVPPEDLRPESEIVADTDLEDRVEIRTPLDLRTERLVVVGVGGERTEIPDEVPSLSVSTETLTVTGVGGEPTEIPETVEPLDVRTETLMVTGSE